jgi:hypothetical protein
MLKAFIRPALIVMIVAFVWRYARSVISESDKQE